MWLPGFPPLVFMITIFCTQIAAERTRVVHYAHVLGLEFTPSGNGWNQVKGPGGFLAEVYVSREGRYVAVSEMLNEHNVLDSNEALLSIWEREAKLSAGRLQRIKYYDVNEVSDVSTFNNIFEAFGYDPNADEGIPEIKIATDDTAHQHLRETTFGSEAIDICTEFKETEGMYITGFDIGRDGSDGRWIRVNLFMEGDEDDE